jgi:hypothetical protein
MKEREYENYIKKIKEKKRRRIGKREREKKYKKGEKDKTLSWMVYF